jgi:molybdopterin molybdotransferase
VTDLLTVEDALERVLAAIETPVDTERRRTADALGRVLAEPVVGRVDLPPWDNSAMDGYAIRSRDVDAAGEDTPATLKVVGEVAAGSAPDRAVEPGTAIRIATGAPVPLGADAVVPVEETTPLDGSGRPAGTRGRDAVGPPPARIAVHRAVPFGGSIRRAGSDLAAGTALIAAGMVLNPARIALAAGAGVDEVAVRRPVRVAVLATGNEIRRAGEELGPAGIPDANGPGLRALVADSGADPIDLGIASDDTDDVQRRLSQAVDIADAVIVSGGVSVGPYDVVRTAFSNVGHVELWRVAVQPGKPFAFGVAERPGRSQVLLFGLPGNPVSTFVAFELFVRPAIRKLAGECRLARDVDRGRLLEPVTKSHGRRAFLRVSSRRDADGRVERDQQGRVPVRLAGGQGSHVMTALAAADALAVVPETVDALDAGADVDLWWLDR